MGKLFLKLWLLILATSLTSFQIQRMVFDWSSNQQQLSNSNERFRRTYVMIEEVLAPFPKGEWQGRFEKLKERVGSPEVFLGPKRLVTIDELVAEGKLPENALAEITAQRPWTLDTADGNGYEVFRTLLGTEYVAVLKAPFARKQPMLIFGVLTSTQFTWLVESSLYALALILWLRLFSRDMRTLERAANRVGEGRFDFDINVRKGAALHPLAESMNAMKERISALLKSHRELTNAVSHEFRTPITRLRFRHELAHTADTAEEKNRQLDAMTSAIDQLDDLARELLEYSRLDRETPSLDFAAIDTAPWIAELVEDARELAKAEKREVKIVSDAQVASIYGDQKYLSRAAANLLRNAVLHAKGMVKIGLVVDKGKRELWVEDDGPGIPAGERLRVFEPFARLDESRNRDSGGFGMGLAIVRQVARWHGGEAGIGDSTLGGARVLLRW
jgi:two-component system, OmpR family, sensor kinase ParS